MKYDEQEDILIYTAKEAGISREHLDLVIKQFWNTVRMYLTNPLSTKKGILINEFGLFFIKPYTIKTKKDRLEKRSPGSSKIELHDKLLKQLE